MIKQNGIINIIKNSNRNDDDDDDDDSDYDDNNNNVWLHKLDDM
jgi:hypothetical protein